MTPLPSRGFLPSPQGPLRQALSGPAREGLGERALDTHSPTLQTQGPSPGEPLASSELCPVGLAHVSPRRTRSHGGWAGRADRWLQSQPRRLVPASPPDALAIRQTSPWPPLLRVFLPAGDNRKPRSLLETTDGSFRVLSETWERRQKSDGSRTAIAERLSLLRPTCARRPVGSQGLAHPAPGSQEVRAVGHLPDATLQGDEVRGPAGPRPTPTPARTETQLTLS